MSEYTKDSGIIKRALDEGGFREALKKYPYVEGCGIAMKITNDVRGAPKETRNICLRIHVYRKVPKNQLAEQDILPSYIEYEGVKILTDVVASKGNFVAA
jgi:hypothetical protein